MQVKHENDGYFVELGELIVNDLEMTWRSTTEMLANYGVKICPLDRFGDRLLVWRGVVVNTERRIEADAETGRQHEEQQEARRRAGRRKQAANGHPAANGEQRVRSLKGVEAIPEENPMSLQVQTPNPVA